MRVSLRLLSVAAVLLGWSSFSSAAVITIVESRTGGINASAFLRDTGGFPNTWASSSAKSTAPGLTAGIGSWFNSTAGAGGTGTWFQYSPTLPQAGAKYSVDITHASTTATISSNIIQTGGTGLPASTAALSTGGHNTWESVGTLTLNPGVTTPTIRFEETSITGTAGDTSARFYADAIRFSLLAPDAVSTPGPADGATGQGTENGGLIDVLLSWAAGATNNFKYDVFLGTTSGSLTRVADDITTTNFSATGLNPNTQYFWRVDAFNVENASATGSEWDFTTAEVIPEPASAGIMLLAGAAVALRRRRA